MKIPPLHKADKWLTKNLSFPGIDEDSLAQKKINLIASIAVTSMIFLLTVTYHIIFPQLKILIYYGFLLTIIYSQGVIYPFIFRRISVWHAFIDQSLVVIITLIAIIKLGGIPNSGGLIFVGLAQVFFSLNFRKRSHSMWIFIIYVLTVIIAGAMHPYLTIPSEMTTSVNVSLFVINILWISGFALVFIMSFITQSVKLEQHETNRLKELDEVKTKLYTNITHEFRTPLTIIKGMLDLIKNEPERWLDEGCTKIENNTRILLNLVNQMLDLSKLEAGAMPLRKIRSDINLYIGYIVELFQSVAESRNITINYSPCQQNPVIDYDPDKLMQIISNLISNALKYIQPSGNVEVSTSLNNNMEFVICVSDNGPGIRMEHLPFIFDRFYRISEDKASPTVGSGLGLALTKELVKLSDGYITAESDFGKGTSFTVSLPVSTNAKVENVPAMDGLKGSLSAYIIPDDETVIHQSNSIENHLINPLLLIVEDNKDVIRYLYTLLENDYEIVTAINGEDGLRKAIELIPDIIISDIMMPVMDGIELLGRIKGDIRTSHIPYIVLTAKADIESRLEGLERGADAYISKPFSKEELIVQLRSLVLQRKRLQERYSSIGNLILNEERDFHWEDEFIKRVSDIMIANLDDEMFDIRKICTELAMSRTQLYRKFRSLTDKTLTEYLRSIRLHKARDLLVSSDITVSEAAYRTGFKNVSHFSRVFLREFKINPSEIHK